MQVKLELKLKKPERFTEQLSALLTADQYTFLVEIAKSKKVSLGEVVRAIIDVACTSLLLEEEVQSEFSRNKK